MQEQQFAEMDDTPDSLMEPMAPVQQVEMAHAMLEPEAAYEPAYNDMFPALPESMPVAPPINQLGQWNNKMRIGSSVVTQVRV